MFVLIKWQGSQLIAQIKFIAFGPKIILWNRCIMYKKFFFSFLCYKTNEMHRSSFTYHHFTYQLASRHSVKSQNGVFLDNINNCSLPEISRTKIFIGNMKNWLWNSFQLFEFFRFWANFIIFLLFRIFDNSIKILTFFDILKNIEKCICAEKCIWNLCKNFEIFVKIFK